MNLTQRQIGILIFLVSAQIKTIGPLNDEISIEAVREYNKILRELQKG